MWIIIERQILCQKFKRDTNTTLDGELEHKISVVLLNMYGKIISKLVYYPKYEITGNSEY